MHVITIAARKGGVGKTTLATHLSVLARLPRRPVLLFDIDPQRSCAWWWQIRPGQTPALIECDARELPEIIAEARREGVDYCFIDTPPHVESSIAEAMHVADLVLVPSRPGPFDLAGVAATFELAKRLGRPTLAVINHAPPRNGQDEPSIVTAARTTLRGMGVDVASSVITQRVALSHAVASGSTARENEPNGKAATEIGQLWVEIQSRLGQWPHVRDRPAIGDQPRDSHRQDRLRIVDLVAEAR